MNTTARRIATALAGTAVAATAVAATAPAHAATSTGNSVTVPLPIYVDYVHPHEAPTWVSVSYETPTPTKKTKVTVTCTLDGVKVGGCADSQFFSDGSLTTYFTKSYQPSEGATASEHTYSVRVTVGTTIYTGSTTFTLGL